MLLKENRDPSWEARVRGVCRGVCPRMAWGWVPSPGHALSPIPGSWRPWALYEPRVKS